jgi:hypothetical protein
MTWASIEGPSHTSPEYPVHPCDELQRFEFPAPVLCVGGMVQVELIGRCRSQDSDGMYYVALAHVRVEGSPLPGYIPALVDDAKLASSISAASPIPGSEEGGGGGGGGGGCIGRKGASGSTSGGGDVGFGGRVRTVPAGGLTTGVAAGRAGGPGPGGGAGGVRAQKLMLRVVRPAVFNALSRVYSGGVGVGAGAGAGGRRPQSAMSAHHRAALAGAGAGGGYPGDESEGSDSSWNSDIED